MLFRARVPIFYWSAPQSCLIQNPSWYSGCYSNNQKLFLGKYNLVSDKEKKEKEMKMCSHTKSSPKSEKKRSFEYNTRKCSCPFVLHREPPTIQGLESGLCYLPHLTASCPWPDSGAPAKQTHSYLTESTSNFPGGCPPVIIRQPLGYNPENPQQFFNPWLKCPVF